MIQRHLSLPIAQRTVLVDTATVRAAHGVDADTVSAWVDEGRLRWVWDVSTTFAQERHIPELRFWTRDVIAPEFSAGLTLGQVIDLIVPLSRERFQAPEVAQLLLISRPTVQLLREELAGELVGHAVHVPRSGLVQFFTRRLVGAFNL